MQRWPCATCERDRGWRGNGRQQRSRLLERRLRCVPRPGYSCLKSDLAACSLYQRSRWQLRSLPIKPKETSRSPQISLLAVTGVVAIRLSDALASAANKGSHHVERTRSGRLLKLRYGAIRLSSGSGDE